jgi:hypothetical protein
LTGAELVPVVQNSGTLQTTVSAIKVFSLGNVENEVSALNSRVDAVSVLAAQEADAITSINAVTANLEVRVSALETAVSAIGDVSVIAALVSNVAILEADVSTLDIRVAAVSALTSVNTAAITSINAVVSTKANRNGDFLTNVQYIDFNTTTSYAPLPGRLTWDIESGTLDLGLTGTVNLLIGQRTVAQIFNNSGVTLPKGKAVRVTGASGQRLTGALAQADSDADSLTIFGIMLETVSVNNSGYVATDGLVRNVDTAAYTDGQVVYLSPVSAGELTPTKPEAPQHLVQMGYIVKGGSVGGGSLYVKVQNGYELGELHDVKTSTSTSLADGEVLVYNVSAKVWTNSPALINAQASISALNVQLAAVSALVSTNTAAITSINAVVSAVETRVSVIETALSAIGDVSAIAALVSTVGLLDAEVSALQIQVNAVSVSVSQRVLKAGDTMTGPLIVDVSSASTALRITQTGTGNALVVEDSANPDATPFVVDASGNVGIGTTSPTVKLDVNGSINGTWAGAAIAVANGGTGATTLTGVVIGNGASAFTAKTNPAGAFVGTTDTQTLANKTAERLILNDGYTEEVFAITDGATVNLDPNNGSIQTWTLGANRTPGQVNWSAGQSITLMIDDGTARTITWTTLGVVWETNGGTAPTLATSGFTVIVLWKVSTTIYGARVGDA